MFFNIDSIKEKINNFGREKRPFLFIIDFDFNKPIVIPLDEVNKDEIIYDINGITNVIDNSKEVDKTISFAKYPIDFFKYSKSFKAIKKEFINGSTFLLNLTFPTYIKTNLTLKEVFFYANAKYKLLYKDNFVVFSPEQFIKIEDNIISTYPMKGTIDSLIPDAENKILGDEKEFAEHITVVDLLRNDLGIISKKVEVEQFRYVEEIMAFNKKLLQVSSKIKGELDENWNEKLGDILAALLPAGSVTGAPKKKTVEIIKRVEGYERGYYTGVFGYFSGKTLDSAVMIRYIEKIKDKLYFKSGGGLTIYSDAEKEYNELVEKVYLPITFTNDSDINVEIGK